MNYEGELWIMSFVLQKSAIFICGNLRETFVGKFFFTARREGAKLRKEIIRTSEIVLRTFFTFPSLYLPVAVQTGIFRVHVSEILFLKSL